MALLSPRSWPPRLRFYRSTAINIVLAFLLFLLLAPLALNNSYVRNARPDEVTDAVTFDQVVGDVCPGVTRFLLASSGRNFTTEREQTSLEEGYKKHYSLKAIQERTKNCDGCLPTPGFSMELPKSRDSHYVFAFSILVHTDIGLLEEQLKMLFRPRFSFCIHLDAKAPKEMLAAVKSLIGCYNKRYPHTSMILAPHPYEVYWGEDTILKSDLKCLELLLRHYTKLPGERKGPSWDFVFSIAGSELPLKSPEVLSQTLKSRFPTGESVVISRYDKVNRYGYESRFKYKWILNLDKKVDKSDPYFHYMVNTNIKKDPAPYDLKICKGPRNIILNRTTAEFMVNHPVSRDLLKWMRDMLIPEEAYYATLFRARVTATSDGYNVTQDLNESVIEPICTRYAVWRDRNENNEIVEEYPPPSSGIIANVYNFFLGPPAPVCHGEYVHEVCNFGLRDIPRIVDPRVVDCLFINKFNARHDATAVGCWAEHSRQWRQSLG